MKISKKNVVVAVSVVAIVLLAIAGLLIANRVKQKNKEEAELKEWVENTYEAKEDEFAFLKSASMERRAFELNVKNRTNDLATLKNAVYTAPIISSWDISNWKEEWLSTFWGYMPYISTYTIKDMDELHDYLEAIFSSKEDELLDGVYLNLDIFSLKDKYYKKHIYDEPLEYSEMLRSTFLCFMEEHPNVKFYIMLPFHSINYWISRSNEKVNDELELIEEFLMYTRWAPNATVTWMGAKEWMMANKNNYVKEGVLCNQTSEHAFLYTYAYDTYNVDPTNFEDYKNTILCELSKYQQCEYEYADMTDYDIVFLGDSLIANCMVDPLSEPGVVNAFTNANTYNLAIGGTYASLRGVEYPQNTFVNISDTLTNGIELEGGDERFYRELERFSTDSHDGKKLLFVIEYGANDFFSSESTDNIEDKFDVTSYGGALRSSVEKLKKKYKEASIILMSPYELEFESATIPVIEYVKVMKMVAEEEGVFFLNLYEDSEIKGKDRFYLLKDDTHHPNEAGIFSLSKTLISFIQTEIMK